MVAEINNGGDMVTEVLRQSEPNLPVRAVHATRGKFLRAEPIAAAYERGLVFHVGAFGEARGPALRADPRLRPPRLRLSRPTAPTRWSGRWPTSLGSTGGARAG